MVVKGYRNPWASLRGYCDLDLPCSRVSKPNFKGYKGYFDPWNMEWLCFKNSRTLWQLAAHTKQHEIAVLQEFQINFQGIKGLL